jgi:hypothetical protein
VPAGSARPGDVPLPPPAAHAPYGLRLAASNNLSYAAVNRLLARGVRVERATEPAVFGDVRVARGDFLLPGAAEPALEEARVELGLDPPARIPEPFTLARTALKAPRIGLFKPWVASMDEGWTRLVLDRFGFRYASLDNEAVRKGGLRARYDAIVLPDVEKSVIVEGKPSPGEAGPGYQEPLPPPYAGGVGKEGVAALKAFVEEGGTLICLTSSSALPIDEFNIPVRDLVARLKPAEFSLPGTLVNLTLDPEHPLAWGMPGRCAAYVTGGPVFGTSVPGAGVDRSVAGRYPTYADEVVASGWAEGTERMAGKAAVVEADLGKGRVVLFGPRVQHRAQTPGTYKLLFNALLLSGTAR